MFEYLETVDMPCLRLPIVILLVVAVIIVAYIVIESVKKAVANRKKRKNPCYRCSNRRGYACTGCPTKLIKDKEKENKNG